MTHLFKQGTHGEKATLLLLHGTGGDERDLLPLANIIDPDASILSVRGNVLEDGMPRFFRRLAEGVFDEEDLIMRTNELNHFLHTASSNYNFERNGMVAVGYSNGANIAASLLFHHKDALNGAILHHPMVPIRGIELPALSQKPIFIGAGTNDPICPPKETEELHLMLTSAGANVHIHWESSGHQLTNSEIYAAKEWYDVNISSSSVSSIL